MEPIAFEISGVAYKARRMDIFSQANIARKIAPLMASGAAQLVRVVKAATEKRLSLADMPPEQMIEQFAPLMAELAKMPEDDLRFVITTCLATVQKDNGAPGHPVWANVWPAGVQEPMFPEFRTDLVLTLRVVVAVIAGTLGNFTLGSR